MHCRVVRHTMRQLRCRWGALQDCGQEETSVSRYFQSQEYECRLILTRCRNADLLHPESSTEGSEVRNGGAPSTSGPQLQIPLRKSPSDGKAPQTSPSVENMTNSQKETLVIPPLLETAPDIIGSPQSRGSASDAAEDSSAYAKTLEGGSRRVDGVPFYPGKNLSLFC